MFRMDLAIRLNMDFRPEALQHDLQQAKSFQFAQHPLNYHDGKWKAINLIAAGGKVLYEHQGDHGFGTTEPIPTPVLDKCPYIKRDVFSRLPGKIVLARLSSLEAGGHIHEHYDATESVDFNHWRIHIPIVTSPEVHFYLGYRRRRWKEGEVWIGDFTFPHSIHNHGSKDRVHLVIDLQPSPELLQLLPAGHMDPAAIARRAKLRKLHKQIAWYKYRLARVDRSGRRDTPKVGA